MVNLRHFCCYKKPSISTPFSIGGYTYATNAHIIIRVPRRTDIQDRADAPRLESYQITSSWGVREGEIPVDFTLLHLIEDDRVSIGEGGPTFSTEYLCQIRNLSDSIMYGGLRAPKSPHYFKFRDGDGLIMPIG